MSMGPNASAPLAGLRVLELTQRYPPALGGVERYVERLALELTRAGATVVIVTSDVWRDAPFARRPFPPSAGPVTVQRHRAILAVPAPHGSGVLVPGMLGSALRAPVDVVHAHAFGHFPLWAGRLVQSLRDVPLVVTPHSDPGSGTFLGRQWSKYVGRTAVRGADITVALSRAEATWLEGIGVRRERIRVIPAAIDRSEFDELPQPLPHPDGPVVLFVGRLAPAQKGLEPLVRAMALLPRSLGAHLRLVGEDWGGLAPVLRLAQSLGIRDRVHAVGAVPRVSLLQEYASADAFVLPSLFDSFPVVVLEALAAGLPVVASRVGAVPEILERGESGLVVPPGNPAALAAAIERALSDQSLRTRLKEAGPRRAAGFDWQGTAGLYLHLFSELAASRATRAPG